MMTPQESPVRFITMLLTIATMGSLVSTSPRKGPACPLQEGLQPMLSKPGADLTLGFMLNLRGSTTGWTAGQDPKAEAGSRCSNDTETFSGMQQKLAAIAATYWPPDSIPLPGLSVGLEFYDACDIYDLAQFSATRYANKRYDELYSDETANETAYPECSNTTLRLGVIGFRTSLWSEHLSNLLNKFDIPVMSFTSTASELSKKEEYPNFFRVVPPDDSAMKALVSVMKEYNWTYTTMVYNDGSPYGESGFETFNEVYEKQMGYCVSEPVKIPERATESGFDDVVNQLVQRGIKVVVLWVKRLHVDQIYGAVDRIGGAAYDIQWLSGDSSLYFDFKDLPGHARAARGLLVVSPFTLPSNATYNTLLDKHYPNDEFSLINLGLLINAVHAYMAAFSYAHQDKCGGQPGMCNELAALQGSEFIEYIKKVNFTGIDGKWIAFDENGDPVYHFYEILQYKRTDDPDSDVYALQKVGEWNPEGLTLNKDEVEFYGSNGTLVDPPESNCEDESCPDPRCKKPDDRPEFVIEAFMTLHDGSDCSTLHKLRFFQLQSALFAVQHVNNNPNQLTDVRLSINVNDICGDDVEEEAFDLIQRWDFDEGFPKKDNSYLLGVFHSSYSANAIDISETLKIAGVPVIDSGATSPALSDKERFGNFLRTVPSDVKQAKAIVDILERLGLTYIQTVNSKGPYGDGGIKAVKEAAKEADICIANSHIVDAETNYVRLVRGLLANSDAKAVVVFLFTAHARALFQELVSMNVKQGRFLFVGSENWGTRSDYIPGLERPAAGALTVSIKSAAVPTFDNYFTSLTPINASSEIFNEYWMDKFKCSLPGSTGSASPCTGSETLSSSDVSSLGLENTINSVLVYANTLNKLINATCQGEGICKAVYDIPREDWLQQLKDISFTSPLGLRKMVSFDENGDGPPLYAVYNFTEMNGNYGYEEIGTWDSMNGLSNVSLPGFLNPMFSSQCNGLCLECNPRPPINQTMDRDMYFHTPGQLNFPVILPLSEADEGVKCGPPRLEEALVLESLLYTLDKINNKSSILPGIKLGVTVVDSCENPAIATRRLVGLLGDFVSLENTGHPFALLGPSNPDVAEAIAKSVTGPSKFPMITHSAVSPDLYTYPLVLRTSATYNYEVTAIVKILLKMDWKYVAVVFSNTPYGNTNYRKFLTERKPAGICLGNQISIDENTNFEDVIRELKMNSLLNVIVAFVDERQARNLLSADDFERKRKFTWIGTNSWDSPSVVSNLEDAAKGMLVVAHRKPDLPEIQRYFSDMDNLQAASQRNPYFRRYLEEHCGPSISNCQLDQKIEYGIHMLSGKIASLVDALIVAAHGADLLLDDKCGPNNQGLCDKFISSDPKEVLRAIESRILPMGASGEPFSFDGKGVPASYAIKNYQYDGQMGQFVEVGEWRNRNLELQLLGIKLYNPEADKPQRNSMGCSCEPEIKVILHGGIWTWIAFDIWSTIVLAISGLCVALALLIGILFLIKRNSYVVQGASFSLSMWLLLGIILMYVLNLAFMFDTNIALCGIRRVGISFVYCVVYAAMFVKSIRANRFAHKKDGVDLNFAGSWSQSLLFLAFLLPEVILVGEWLFLIPPGITLAPSADNTCSSGALETICSTTNIDLTTFMLYAYFLVLLTFLSSIGALKSSHAQHEAKTIFISSLFSICILVAWACVINLLDEKYADPAIPIGLTADATFILFFMFIGKVGSLTKKDDVDEDGTGTLKRKKHSDPEERPEKTLNVYDNMAVIGGDENGGVTTGDEVTQF